MTGRPKFERSNRDSIWYDKKSKKFWLGITTLCYDLRVTSTTVYDWIHKDRMPKDIDLIRVPMKDLKYSPKRETEENSSFQ